MTCVYLIIQDVRFPLSRSGVPVNVHLHGDYLLDAHSGALIIHLLHRRILKSKAAQKTLQLDLFLRAGTLVRLDGGDNRCGSVCPQRGAGQARVTADGEGVVAVVRAGGGGGRAGPSAQRGLSSVGAPLVSRFVLG